MENKTNLKIRFHYYTNKNLLLKSMYRISQDKDGKEKEEIKKEEFTLSSDATDFLLSQLPEPYFDYRIDLISEDLLPYRDGSGYLSLSNERYITNELNSEYISELSKIDNNEIQELVGWMKRHGDVPWYLVGLVDVEIAGKPCRDIVFPHLLSDYVI